MPIQLSVVILTPAGNGERATNSRQPCHTHLCDLSWPRLPSRVSINGTLFETGLWHMTCFGQCNISKRDVGSNFHRACLPDVYPLLLLFEILRPPAEESQASLLEGEMTWSRQAVPAEAILHSPACQLSDRTVSLSQTTNLR